MDILFLIAIGLSGVALGGLLYLQNNEIVLRRHAITFEFLPKEFDGFLIAHLSDLHNKQFGKGQQRLIDVVRRVKPDIIVMTGDMVDMLFYRAEPFLELVGGLRDVAPIYYVTGNHEWYRSEYDDLKRRLIDQGVHVLDNRSEEIVRGDRKLVIAGIDDPARYQEEIVRGTLLERLGQYTEQQAGELRRVVHRELDAVRQEVDERAFKLLLAHRPELLREYIKHHFSLILSGHAHGGQWNVPGIGPLIAPGQGLFPRLASGIHWRHGTAMVISAGIGNSGIAFQRLFNKPEVVAIALKKSTESWYNRHK